MEAFREAVRLQPKFLLALLNLARAQLMLKDYAATAATLRQVLTLEPKNPIALTLLAEVDLAQKQYAKAYVRFRRAIALNPDLPDAREGFVTVLRALGQTDAADIQAATASELRRWPRPVHHAQSTIPSPH